MADAFASDVFAAGFFASEDGGVCDAGACCAGACELSGVCCALAFPAARTHDTSIVAVMVNNFFMVIFSHWNAESANRQEYSASSRSPPPECSPLALLHVLCKIHVEVGGMAMPAKSDLPQGTLDLLILKVVALGSVHGYAIA